jgi:AAA15 family ATPase/GTPase
MLTRFEVSDFKNFKGKFVFDLTTTGNYDFNHKCVKNGVLNKGMIYGPNGAGKSNLGFAIFDITMRLTDKDNDRWPYLHYLNAFSKNEFAEFKYVFSFKEGTVEYNYGKYNMDDFAYEELKINHQSVISLDRRKTKKATVSNLKGAENLNTDVGDSNISIVNYVRKNTVLNNRSKNNRLFNLFIKYIEGMLFFRALNDSIYLGFERGRYNVLSDIIQHGNIEDFKQFLNEAGIECKLAVIDKNGKPELVFSFDGKIINFSEIASTGTRSLTLFYFWWQRLKKNKEFSFIFIDEFDAFYHHELSELIVKKLRELENVQVILTTHNTSIMTNDLFRPDCYFLMNKEVIKPLDQCTEKELRFAHNLEKIYRANGFHV